MSKKKKNKTNYPPAPMVHMYGTLPFAVIYGRFLYIVKIPSPTPPLFYKEKVLLSLVPNIQELVYYMNQLAASYDSENIRLVSFLDIIKLSDIVNMPSHKRPISNKCPLCESENCLCPSLNEMTTPFQGDMSHIESYINETFKEKSENE